MKVAAYIVAKDKDKKEPFLLVRHGPAEKIFKTVKAIEEGSGQAELLFVSYGQTLKKAEIKAKQECQDRGIKVPHLYP